VFLFSSDPEWDKSYPPVSGNTVTVFLIDGLSGSLFESEMKAGRLPVLRSMMATGTYVKNGICSFPTMTGYGYYPFITGKDATESGILGLRWFDRSRQGGNFRNYVGRTNVNMNDDITDTIRNVFEMSQPHYTASINTFMNKGVAHNIKTGWSHTTAKYEGRGIFRWLRAVPVLGRYMAPDHFEHETNAMDLALRQLAKNPRVHWVTFPSPDAANHVFGTTAMYTGLLHHIDSLIGVYISETRRLGQQQTRMIAVVSDHGISDVDDNLDFSKWLAAETGLLTERGKSVHILSPELDAPLSDYDGFDGFFVINGNLAGYLYMKDPLQPSHTAWRHNLPPELLEAYPTARGTINLPEVLSKNPKLELVISRGKSGRISIRNGPENLAEIYMDAAGRILYHPVCGNPLLYPETVHDTFLSKSEWLDKTLDSEFPYAIVRIWQLLNKPGIGDVVLTSRKGVDLAYDYEMFVGNYKGGHGGLRREILSVPFIYSIPGGKPGVLNGMTNERMGEIIIRHLNERPE